MEGLFIVGAFLVGVWFFTRPRRGAASWVHPWVRAGRELGLKATEDGVAGTVSGLPVAVAVRGERLVIRVDGGDGVPGDLTVGPADGGRDGVATGDPVFDAQVRLEGDAEALAGLMSWETRQPLRAAVLDLGCVVRAGVLEASLHRQGVDAHLIVAQTRQLVRLARQLRWRAEAAAERLCDNAVDDPKPGVRLANLELLLARHGGSAFAQQALARAVDDPDGRVRSAAGRADEAGSGGVARHA